MSEQENNIKQNIASLIITTASLFHAWNSRDKSTKLTDIAQSTANRVLSGSKPNNNPSKPKNKNRGTQKPTKAKNV